MWVSALSQRFRFAMTKAGLDLNFHGLRHGNATLSLSAEIDFKVTSQRLGHSTIGITADFYSHVTRSSTGRQRRNSMTCWPH
jgi:integrase